MIRGDSRACSRTQLSAVETERKSAGLSQARLAEAAGVNLRFYLYILAGKRGASAKTVARLQAALRRLTAPRPGPTPDDLVRAAYGGCLAAVAPRHGVDPELAPATLAGPERPSNDHWRACSRARAEALYLANTRLGVAQNRLAAVAGVTPAAVCQSVRAVEARRDAGAVDAALRAGEIAIAGSAGF